MRLLAPLLILHRFALSSSASKPVSMSKLRLSLIQLRSSADKVANIQHARDMILRAVSESQLDLVVLPECWNSPYSTASFPVYAESVPSVGGNPDPTSSPSTQMLVDVAKEKKIWIVGGSYPERDLSGGSERLFNTCLVINPDGAIVGKHRKVHLFDIDVPGKITFKESDSLSAGDSMTVVETPWGNLGVGICYDIRFPELALLMRQKGCKMLIYPGAFNMVTGPAHWELLQRARAVDNQVFVAACSPSRIEGSGYVAWGHSSIISPWGEVVAKAGAEEEIINAELDFESIESIRMNIPCWLQKRHDLYEVKAL